MIGQGAGLILGKNGNVVNARINTVADSKIVLAWEIGNESSIDYYKIYRKDTTSIAFAFIDSSQSKTYADTALANSVLISYKITAVDNNGYEG